MTAGHKHRHVNVRYNSRLYRALKKPLVRLDWTHRAYIERSRLVWGVVDLPEAGRIGSEEYHLTLLGLLHGLTGLTIRVK